MQKSVRWELLILWLSITAVALVLVWLLLVLTRQSAGPQIARARHHASASCEALQAGTTRTVQVLDGVGAGLLGVALPGLVAHILRGSGHVNAGLGAVMTVQGLGAAVSPAFAGLIAHHFGYGAAFICLSAIAAIGLLICRLGMSVQMHFDGLEPAA